MASGNNAIWSRLHYLRSLIFCCYQNTKTGFEEEELEWILQVRQIPLYLQKKKGKVKKNNNPHPKKPQTQKLNKEKTKQKKNQQTTQTTKEPHTREYW